MNDTEATAFASRLSALFQGKVNAEQLKLWLAYVRKFKSSDAESALNEYAANERRGSPNLSAFRAKLSAISSGRGDATGRRCHSQYNHTEPDWLHGQRHQWMKADPSRANLYDSMSGEDVELEYRQGVFRDAIWIYGKSHPQTRRFFDDWQAKVEAAGYDTGDFDLIADAEIEKRHRVTQ